MAGTMTLTSDTTLRDINQRIIGKRLVIDCTADAADGSFPNNLVLKKLNGYLQPVITDPGSTAPTDNYDVALYHPSDATANMVPGLADRDTANTEIAVATISGSAVPAYLNGNYTLKITNNSVNSASVTIIMEVLAVTA